jgi:hypothetical protein
LLGVLSNPDWYTILAIVVANDGSKLVRMIFFALFRLLQGLDLANQTRRYEVFILIIVDWCCWKSLACITGAAGEFMWDALFVLRRKDDKTVVIWMNKTNDMAFFVELLFAGIACYHEIEDAFQGDKLIWTSSALYPSFLISF